MGFGEAADCASKVGQQQARRRCVRGVDSLMYGLSTGWSDDEVAICLCWERAVASHYQSAEAGHGH